MGLLGRSLNLLGFCGLYFFADYLPKHEKRNMISCFAQHFVHDLAIQIGESLVASMNLQ